MNQNQLLCIEAFRPLTFVGVGVSCSPPSVRQRGDLFYLQPNRSCVPSSPLWFLPAPLNDNTMEAVMMRTLAVRELRGGPGGGAGPAPRTLGDPSFTPDQDSQ